MSSDHSASPTPQGGEAAGAAPVEPAETSERPAGSETQARSRRGGVGRGVALFLILMLPVWLVAGVWFGGHPHELPSFARSIFEEDHETEVTAEAINMIARDYYRRLSKSALSSSSIAGAVQSLNDPFSNYLNPNEFHEFAVRGHFSGVGVEVAAKPLGLRIERVFDSSPAERAGLKPGETIIGVNGRLLKGLPEQKARSLIIGPPGTPVKLTVQEGPMTHTVEITRETILEPAVASEVRTVDGKKLGVVALATFSDGVHGEVREAVEQVLHEGAQGIVFDLRHNGGGLVSEARLVASIFVPHGVIVSMHARTQPSLTLYAAGGAIPASIPVVVLVDRDTASAAEIVTAALQDHHRATVMGTHTFGKGVFQELEPLSNGGALDITVGEYFTPNGRNLGGGGVKEGAGITPEVALGDNVIDTEAGLQAALHHLAAQVG
jgi:carboxyl-terminal processing protease